MPEHFVALVKQFANLSSNVEAKNASVDIAKSLYLTLTEDQLKLFFVYTPSYLHIKPNLFNEILNKRSNSYNHSILLDRIEASQNLTDTAESQNRVKAYFMAIAVVVGEKRYKDILDVLPAELKALLAKKL